MSAPCRSSWWQDRAPREPVAAKDLLGPGAVLVLSPHPDDETLGCGGLLAAAASLGVPAHIVALSDGGGSHPGSRSHRPARLAALRRAEQALALARLGLPGGVALRLGFADGGVPSSGPQFLTAVRAVRRLALATAADAIFATWAEDPHCDHRACACLAAAVAAGLPGIRRFSYPLWGRVRPPGAPAAIDAPQAVEVLSPLHLDIRPWLPRKRAALAAHRSQLGLAVVDDPAGFVLPDELLRLCLEPAELFLRHDRHAVCRA
ncbi:MAG: PIG-L deacetylase family protein [Sneathiellaceae bacterium]